MSEFSIFIHGQIHTQVNLQALVMVMKKLIRAKKKFIDYVHVYKEKLMIAKNVMRN